MQHLFFAVIIVIVSHDFGFFLVFVRKCCFSFYIYLRCARNGLHSLNFICWMNSLVALEVYSIFIINKVCWYLFNVIFLWILWTFESADNFPMITHEIVCLSFVSIFSLCLGPLCECILYVFVHHPNMAFLRLQKFAMIATDFYELFYGPSH